MMKMKPLLVGLCASALFVGCGTDGVDLDQVQEDFDNPSGSTQDQDALISAADKLEGTTTGLETAFVNPFGGGFGLTAQRTNIARFHPQRLAHPLLRWAYARVGISRQFLGEDDIGECINDQILSGVSGNVTPSGGEASFDVTIDLGDCTSDASGSISMSGSMELTENSLRMDLEYTYDEVCITIGNQACIDGTVVAEMNSDSLLGGSIDMIMGWNFAASWKDDSSKSRSIDTKGGLRIQADKNQGALEYLVYVRNSAGDEVSYVLRIAANAEGASITIKGNDGEVSCNFLADGSGSCSGSANPRVGQRQGGRDQEERQLQFLRLTQRRSASEKRRASSEFIGARPSTFKLPPRLSFAA